MNFNLSENDQFEDVDHQVQGEMQKNFIPVTRPHLPLRSRLDHYIDEIYQSACLTNFGPLHNRLQTQIADYLCIDHERIVLVSNGSLALQVAFKALGLTGEVLTTPFSFIATMSTLIWEGLKPVFCDIDPYSFTLDPKNLGMKITSRTSAILPVHVFGSPCEVEAIESFASSHNLPVIYDASHCFSTILNGRSILDYGEISTLSFHATKLFHSVEGGALVFRDKYLAAKVKLMINFGLDGPNSINCLGTNAKMSEFHAAMGLAMLDELPEVLSRRKEVWEKYREALSGSATFQMFSPNASNNHSYFPVLLRGEEELLQLQAHMLADGISTRRYFYPSLNKTGYLGNEQMCPISESVSSRILCLPIFSTLTNLEQERVIKSFLEGLGR